jgi:hypothetical protein
MGISISAYKGIKRVDCGHFNEDGEPIDQQTGDEICFDFRAYANPDFPGREEGVEDRGFYIAEESGDGFSAGYGSYNRLRDELAKLAGWPEGEYEQYGKKWPSHCADCWSGKIGAFSELINFSDCEGCIGSVVSKKLAADFAQFQDKADAHENEFFRSFYTAMRESFELAAQDGCVTFH